MIEIEPPKRVALYARYSTDMQSPLSIRDQLSFCRDFAAKKNWVVVKEYHDEQLTSASPFREGYQALLADIDRSAFDVVVAETMDRLTRDPEDGAQIYKRAEYAGVTLHMLAEGEMDLLKVGFAGIQGSQFLHAISQRTRRGLIGKVKDGKSAGGRAYGYRPKPLFKANGKPDGSDLEIAAEEALIVKRIFREFAEGKSPIQIAGALNQAGIPSPRGRGEGSGHWKQNTINGNRKRGTGILNNELYIGRRVWNRQTYVRHPITRKRVARPVPEDDWLSEEVPHLRIIDDELWKAVKTRQDDLSAKRGGITPTKGDTRGASASQAVRRRKYLLSGLLTCHRCGGNSTVAGKGERRRYYCANAKEKGRSRL
ncbi:recombinase family protein [Tropicimonas sp. TH_r6]|uniref:recombinase family protein n=1 Tax=Tropicimonas sp. TH_r6 TaxID=3082085 RepID=UPI002954E094|nr:recombinase family protein [Tropicimonas sp. TH_r6]MDV7145883.1 recombinase family protein [Tropicimonas sp. TH_r6]